MKIKKALFLSIIILLVLALSLSASLFITDSPAYALIITGVKVSPNIRKATATYAITCNTSGISDGTLITVTFPLGTGLGNITSNDAKINSVPIRDIQIHSNKIYFTVHSLVRDPCVIEISNVVNPNIAGVHTLAVNAGGASDTYDYEIISVTAPVTTKAVVSTTENTPVTIELIATDAESDKLTYNIVSNPNHGSLSSISGNSVTYTPDIDYTGTDSFSFKASDATLDSNIAIVTININPVPTSSTATTTSTTTTPTAITTTATPTPTQPSTTYEISTTKTTVNVPTTTTSSSPISTTTSSKSGFFSSCSPSKTETSSSAGDSVIWGSFGTALLGSYIVAQRRKKK